VRPELPRVPLPLVVVVAAVVVSALLGIVVLGLGAPVPLRAEPPPPTPVPSPIPPSQAVTVSAPAAPAATRLAGVATADLTAPDNVDGAGNTVSYAAANLVDGDPATTWRATGDVRGSSLRITFAAPRLVTAVGLVNGYAKVDPATGLDRYAEERRVTAVTWSFDDGTTYVQELDDGVRAVQRMEIEPVRSGVVTLRIDATTPPGDLDRDYTAISEVELLGA
jgi:hypothetical protein